MDYLETILSLAGLALHHVKHALHLVQISAYHVTTLLINLPQALIRVRRTLNSVPRIVGKQVSVLLAILNTDLLAKELQMVVVRVVLIAILAQPLIMIISVLRALLNTPIQMQ